MIAVSVQWKSAYGVWHTSILDRGDDFVHARIRATAQVLANENIMAQYGEFIGMHDITLHMMNERGEVETQMVHRYRV